MNTRGHDSETICLSRRRSPKNNEALQHHCQKNNDAEVRASKFGPLQHRVLTVTVKKRNVWDHAPATRISNLLIHHCCMVHWCTRLKKKHDEHGLAGMHQQLADMCECLHRTSNAFDTTRIQKAHSAKTCSFPRIDHPHPTQQLRCIYDLLVAVRASCLVCYAPSKLLPSLACSPHECAKLVCQLLYSPTHPRHHQPGSDMVL